MPATGDCFFVHVMSGKEERFPREQCDEIKKRAIFLTSQDWKMLKYDILTNCQYSQCVQLTGAFDSLFLAIDKAMQTPGGL